MSATLALHPMAAPIEFDWQPWQQGIVAYCSGKIGFSSFDAAMHALDVAISKRTHNPRRLELRAYPCNASQLGTHWHLTSKPQRITSEDI